MQLARVPRRPISVRATALNLKSAIVRQRAMPLSPESPVREDAAAQLSGAVNAEADVPQAATAWAWFNKMGAPKYWVAPMVDQSELAFRMLCRRHGSTAAYTPMLHARLFLETPAYRAEHFTTCDTDRPLLAQFCANDPQVLLAAAQLVEAHVDGIDLNLGCPQRIARRGRYGAYLMDELPLVEKMVRTLAANLSVPITVKIRRFDDIQRTVDYAAMLERAGASMVAIHGRTREQKRASVCRADWEVIAAVKRALRVPVLANGNVQTLQDVHECMAATGADGVLSAESLLADPALFAARRLEDDGAFSQVEGPALLLEYLDLVEQYQTPFRMLKGHAFKLLGPWLSEFVDLRDQLNKGPMEPPLESLRELTLEVQRRIEALGRSYAVPKLSEKQLAALEAKASLEAAIAEQQREEEGLRQVDEAVPAIPLPQELATAQ